MKRALIVLVALTLSAAAAPAADAPPAAPDEATLAGQVARLNATMTEMAGLLNELVKRQKADLLMKRIELATRGLTDLERRVQGTRDEIDEMERGRRRILEEIERVSQAEDEPDAIPGVPSPSAEERRELQASLERELRYIEDRLAGAQSRIVELENDLAVRLDDLEAWEELVDKALGLR